MSKRHQHGFSLIELAVVLVIVGLLIGGGIAALDATQTQGLRAEQSRQLANVREALYGFAMQEGRLPCPDDPLDGIDGKQAIDGSGPTCEVADGVLPYAELGVGARDAWGEPLYYAVDRVQYAEFDTDGGNISAFPLTPASTVEDIQILDAVGGNTLAAPVPAVVLSFGPQGGQVWTSGFSCPGTAGGFSADETENCDRDRTFVDPGYRQPDTSDGRFDDLVTWLPAAVLKSKMVEVRKLPLP